MSRSPAHCRYALDQDLAGITDWDDTPSRRLGRLAHAVFLGQPLPIVFPGEARRGKAWTEFKEAHAGKDIVKQEELDTAIAMAQALIRHDEARGLLAGNIEETLYYDFAGRPMRSTPDVHLPGHHLTELKTTTDASPGRFPWQALKLGYHGQVAMQVDAVIAKGHPDPAQKSIVAIESKAPHAICVFGLTDAALDFGRRLYRSWLEAFLVCEAANDWPSYGQGILDSPPEEEGLVGLDDDD